MDYFHWEFQHWFDHFHLEQLRKEEHQNNEQCITQVQALQALPQHELSLDSRWHPK